MLVKSLNQNCREFSIWRDQIAADTTAGLSRRFMGVQVDFLVFDRTQSRSTNNVVPPRPLAVHGDGDLSLFHQRREVDGVNSDLWSELKISGLP